MIAGVPIQETVSALLMGLGLIISEATLPLSSARCRPTLQTK